MSSNIIMKNSAKLWLLSVKYRADSIFIYGERERLYREELEGWPRKASNEVQRKVPKR